MIVTRPEQQSELEVDLQDIPRQSERIHAKQDRAIVADNAITVAKRSPLKSINPNTTTHASTASSKDLGLTPAEQSRIILALSMRHDESNNVRMPFEDCDTLLGLLTEIVEGPYHGLVESTDAIRAVWLSTSDASDASKLYLRPSKQSSTESYRQFLGREVKQLLEQEGSTCVMSVVVEV